MRRAVVVGLTERKYGDAFYGSTQELLAEYERRLGPAPAAGRRVPAR